MKRCLPDLKIPQQYRCESCIDGKIHMFGHKACKQGQHTQYPPGTYIDTDLSGPYARSLTGARYSQLYLDRGSGYLWGARQHRKVEHYISTPKIFVDSWELSGRKVQILRTDGNSVFGSVKTREIVEAYQVRHEYSAPYDSDTNPFVKRARRTVFEGCAQPCSALEFLLAFGERLRVTRSTRSTICLRPRQAWSLLLAKKLARRLSTAF